MDKKELPVNEEQEHRYLVGLGWTVGVVVIPLGPGIVACGFLVGSGGLFGSLTPIFC